MKPIRSQPQREALSAKKVAKKAAKKTVKKAPAKKVAKKVARLMPPAGGATVRMYRTGHGDCFLVAFAGDDRKQPSYVLIDCGYKGGSPPFVQPVVIDRIDAIAADIIGATGGKVQVAVITHEHEDHVNGMRAAPFAGTGLLIQEVWLAWTEDPDDKLAKLLRKQYHDQLRGLVAARSRLHAAGDASSLRRLDELFAMELGLEPDLVFSDEEFDPQVGPARQQARGQAFEAAAKDPQKSSNKIAMDVFKKKKNVKLVFHNPHERIVELPGAGKVRVYVLGPPKKAEMLNSMDPVGSEEFHGIGIPLSSTSNYFAAAASAPVADPDSPAGNGESPFSLRYRVSMQARFSDKPKDFFVKYYGPPQPATVPRGMRGFSPPKGQNPVVKIHHELPDNAGFRQIDQDWLYSSGQLALAMNSRTNNTSLVLAFELGEKGKVLLFAADAQRGNILSWTDGSWKDGKRTVTVKDLMARTVLFKASHHGSHNGLLDGRPEDEYPNISWLGSGRYADEFTAMITAVPEWARTKKWNHPFPPIETALKEKCRGRVIQTELEPVPGKKIAKGEKILKPANVSREEWKAFLSRLSWDKSRYLYFDYSIG